MKTDFMIALTQLAAERNMPRDIILRTIETALVSIFKKSSFATDQEITVEIIPQTGQVKVYTPKKVVEKPTNSNEEISLSEAKKLKKDIAIGEMIEVESTPANAGRIAAQAAKQIILQRLREVERDTIFGEYAGKEGEVVSGVVNHIESKQIVVDLGKAEAILPLAEQVNADHYRIGQRLKLYLMRALRTSKGTQLIVSRTHPNLLRRLFELEVPEIYNGTVELKALAREPGYRNKIAVIAKQEGVDAVGCCVGLRSIRIQNITKELNDEKIDVVQWDPDPAVFIANALSPAPVVEVEINEEEKSAVVVVPDKKLSLAIGKGGQNARLAARLTGWRIDIKSLSTAEAERAETTALGEEVVPAEVTAAVEEVTEPTLEPIAEEVIPASEEVDKAEEIIPVSEEAEELVLTAAEVETPVAAEDAPHRTYSVEEILLELEAATESFQAHMPKETPLSKSDAKSKKDKEKEMPIAEKPKVKGKSKAPRRRPRTIEDEEDDTD